MSDLSQVQAKKFEMEVHEQFRVMVDDIRPMVRVSDCSGAASSQFPVFGKGISQKRGAPSSDIPAANLGYTPVVVTPDDYTYADYTDVFKQAKVNFDDRAQLANEIAQGLMRRLMQMLLDAFAAATIANTVAKDISGSSDNLNLTMVLTAAKLLGANGVPKADRHWLTHSNNIHHFAGTTTVASSDYNKNNVLNQGGIDNYYGFKFHELGDMDEGGLPVASSVRTNYAWHKRAVGLAINLQPRVEVNYVPVKGSHFVAGFLSAKAGVIDATGVVEISCDESVA